MARVILFSLLGYLCGSVLFAKVFGKIFGKNDIWLKSKDHNPGTTNAYLYGGFWCGTCTLCGDLLKGFIPIHFFMLGVPLSQMRLEYALVFAAPVIGHVFPIFDRFRGGKGIAVTFGCFLGLFPYVLPFCIFAASFLFFTLILRISPNFYRTIFAYLAALGFFLFLKVRFVVCIGFFLIALTVCLKMHLSKEEREKIKVGLVWTH